MSEDRAQLLVVIGLGALSIVALLLVVTAVLLLIEAVQRFRARVLARFTDPRS